MKKLLAALLAITFALQAHAATVTPIFGYNKTAQTVSVLDSTNTYALICGPNVSTHLCIVPVANVSGLAPSATTDTTNASNITSGTLAVGRLPAFGGGDCTSTAGSASLICTKTNGNPFVASAVVDTTNASNISSGSFALARFPSIAANTALANTTAAAAVPTATSLPSCSGAANALTYTTSSGFGCNTISASNLNFPATVSGTTNSGGLPYFSAATTLSSSPAGTANDLIAWGGAGTAPKDTSILYTNVATLNGTQTFSGSNTFSTNMTVVGIQGQSSASAYTIQSDPSSPPSYLQLWGSTTGNPGLAVLQGTTIDLNYTTLALNHPLTPANGGTGGSSAGTSGQVLQSNGTNILPTSCIGRQLLATLTASSSASLSDTTHFGTTCNHYEVYFNSLVPSASSANFQIKVYVGGTLQTTNYNMSCLSSYSGGTTTTVTNSAAASQFNIANGGDQGTGAPGINGQFTFNSFNTVQTQINLDYVYTNGTGASVQGKCGGWNYGSSGVISGIQVLYASGTITSGTVQIYGFN